MGRSRAAFSLWGVGLRLAGWIFGWTETETFSTPEPKPTPPPLPPFWWRASSALEQRALGFVKILSQTGRRTDNFGKAIHEFVRACVRACVHSCMHAYVVKFTT